MLVKAMILEALVAAAAFAATPVNPVEDAKTTHTPLAACPGRSKVYVALSSFSAPASFCSSYLPIKPTTHTVTQTLVPDHSVPTMTKTKTVKSTVIVSTTSTTSGFPRCTASARRRDVNAVIEERTPASLHVPSPLNKFGRAALSSACHCMSFPTSTVTMTVTSTAALPSGKSTTLKVTTTVTSVTTSTRTASAVASANAQFIIQAITSNATVSNTYLTLPGADGNPSGFLSDPNESPNLDAAAAAVFSLNTAGNLIELEGGTLAAIANQDQGVACEFVYYNDQAFIDSAQAASLTCCVDGNNELSCVNGNGATSFSFGPSGGLYFCTATSETAFGGLEEVALLLHMV